MEIDVWTNQENHPIRHPGIITWHFTVQTRKTKVQVREGMIYLVPTMKATDGAMVGPTTVKDMNGVPELDTARVGVLSEER